MKRMFRRWLQKYQVVKDHVTWRITDSFFLLGQFFRKVPFLVGMWWYRHNGRYLVEGLPAILAGVAAIVLAILALLHSRDKLIAAYSEQATQSSAAKNYGRARIALERLTLLDEARPEFRFNLARVEFAQSQKNLKDANELAQKQDERARRLADLAQRQELRGWALVDTVAPLNQQGYGPAHLVLAQRWWMSQPRTPVKLQWAEIHLRRALQANPEDADAHALLGQLLWATGRLDDAEAELTLAAPQRPAAELALAQLFRARGKRDAANTHAQTAETFFRRLAEGNMDNHAARINWAETVLFLDKPERAVEILDTGLALTNSVVYRTALSAAYVAWADKLAREGKGSLPERLTLLEKSLDFNPGNLDVLQRLLVLAKFQDATIDRNWALLRTQGDRLAPLQLGLQHTSGNLAGLQLLLAVNWIKDIEGDKARATLRTMLAQGKSTAMIHVILGMDAQGRGKLAEAQEHYEQAYKLAPGMPVVVNNMAWVLAHGPLSDLNRALQMIDTALEQYPNHRNFRDTRGQVLGRLGRWKEAVVDLEAALAAMPANRELHLRLVEAYEKLGQPEIAAEHQRLANQLAARE